MTEQPSESATESTEPGSGLVRLRWLKILRYRNVRPGTELRFDDTRNILLGKNGSGKTTLLKLLAAVISSEFRLLDDPYELEYEIEVSGLHLLIKAWTEEPENQLFFDFPLNRLPSGTIQGHRQVRHFRVSYVLLERRVTVEVDSLGGRIESEGKELAPYRNIWLGDGPALQCVVNLVNESSGRFPSLHELETQIGEFTLELGSCTRRFDESLDTFRELTGSMRTMDVLAAPHLIGLRVSGETEGRLLAVPGTSGPLWQKVETSSRVLEPEDILVSEHEKGPLRLLISAFGLASVEVKLRFQEKQVNEKVENWHYRLLRFQFSRPSGAIFSHEALSYGQKRLLAFLYYLSVNDHIVIADELVNGLHHEWITLCLDEMGSRQAFLTSQNPLLLDYLPPESVAQARQRYILCRGEGEELIWENMPEAEAERFFRAYAVGIQHVSEVLQEKGLW